MKTTSKALDLIFLLEIILKKELNVLVLQQMLDLFRRLGAFLAALVGWFQFWTTTTTRPVQHRERRRVYTAPTTPPPVSLPNTPTQERYVNGTQRKESSQGPPPPSPMNRLLSRTSMPSRHRKLLILDLDETLVHSTTRSTLYGSSPSMRLIPALRIELCLFQHPVLYYVYLRPHVKHFLASVWAWYDLAIYTASVREYADVVVDYLCRHTGISIPKSRRFFRDDCLWMPSPSMGHTQGSPSTDDTQWTDDPRPGVDAEGMGEETSTTPVATLQQSITADQTNTGQYIKDITRVAQEWLRHHPTLRHRRVRRRSRVVDGDNESEESSSSSIPGRHSPTASRFHIRQMSFSSVDSYSADMHHAMAVSSGVYTTMDVPTTPTSMRRTSAVGDESDVVLKHAILVDNSELSFTMQPHNGIPVEAWMSDPHDEALLDLLPLLDALRFVHDVRSVLGLRTGVFS
jgi:hypothetical protein